MPIGKRTTQDKEGRNAPGRSKKKGKSHEHEDVKAKKKRRARRKFHVSNFPLGDGQLSYDLKEDLTSRKADVTFGQLIEMMPKLKRQWKRMVNPMEKEPETVTGVSRFWIRLENHQKVNCLGVVKSLEVEAYDAKVVVNFHVMPAGLGAYPIILGRPWLRAVGAIQDWRCDTISLYGKTGVKKLYNMDTMKVMEEPYEDENESSDEYYSTVSDEDSDSTTSSDEDVDVAFLLMNKEIHESGLVAFANEIEDESEGPYEVIEGLMKTKVESSKNQELMTQMISGDLLAMEKEIYLSVAGYERITKQLATFIHKVKYMARFIPLSSQLLYPLQQVAKHDPLQWDYKCEEVFQEVKEVLGGLSAMQAPDWEQVFYVNPSVGDDAIGAMLLQKGKLINGTNMSNVVKKWVTELQEFEFSFLVENSTRATLADLLTYKENPLLVKEEVVAELYIAPVTYVERETKQMEDFLDASQCASKLSKLQRRRIVL
ncbi:hypothetical protein L7F22_014564 [Adiantum nelumboides]|nr:hypothetical protein [Adiantum nelumboides]